MSTAIYIGAGLDVIPPIVCLDIHRFIYVDAGPFRDLGCIRRKNYAIYLSERDHVMQQVGFYKQESSAYPSCHVYHCPSTSQEILYYDNTLIPEDLSWIAEWLEKADTLIIAGHDPILPEGSFPFPNITRIVVNLHTAYHYDFSEQGDYKGRSTVCQYYANRPIVIDCMCEDEPYPYWENNVTRETAKRYQLVRQEMSFAEFEVEKRDLKKRFHLLYDF